jgi:hypothetical protein
MKQIGLLLREEKRWPRKLLMSKFGKSGKPDHPVSHFGLSSFGGFRAKPRKKLNLKI